MIKDNVAAIISMLPPQVELVAAAKTRTPHEVLAAVEAGVKIIGENYVKEAEAAFKMVGGAYRGQKLRWHLIGHLQTNKVKKAVEIFDMIETVDSLKLAAEIDKRAAVLGKQMEVLIEVNSGHEEHKNGVLPEEVELLAQKIAALKNVKIMGLMTMGPFSENPEALRPAFIKTRQLFEKIKTAMIPGVEMKYLSMGMSSSFLVAIEEGANLIRIGTRIFGERLL